MTRTTLLLLLGLALLLAGPALSEEPEAEAPAPAPAPGWLGVTIEIAADGDQQALSIGGVVDDSPAARAGIRVGDVILRAGDVEIASVESLREVLSSAKAGDSLALRLRRGAETLDLEVTLGPRPPPPVRGITGQKAPPWKVETWSGLPEGVEKLDVTDFAGRVVYLYCFQSWCPGCHERGFPTLQAVESHYAKDERVAFVVVQTVFEGFETNTLENGRKTLQKFELTLPYGMSGGAETRSLLMKDYNTGGTPWTIVIDPQGVVRFDGFSIEAKKAIELIDGLLPVAREGEPDSGD